MRILLPSSYQALKCRFCSTTANTEKRPSLSLTFDKFPGSADGPPLIVLHGLLGNRNNWKTIAKVLVKATKRTIYTLDARNHGESPHTFDMNYVLMGADILEFMDRHSIARAGLMGHSMGGRAAMAAALNAPMQVSQLIVLDISPFGVSSSISTVPRFVELMRRVELPVELELPAGRMRVDEVLRPLVPDIATRQFLLTNLYKRVSDGAFAWRANLDAISRMFNPHVCTFPLEECGSRFDGPTTFIGGALSDYISPQDHPAIKSLFPRAVFHYLAEAGHWLHMDRPKEFLELVTPIVQAA